ncbi:MAG: hypothetical protein IJO23_05085 [Bacteroidales bacterium]|nr:hypothetical protein [Bacteroidales bacterium]
MKKFIYMSLALLMLCSCGNNKVYRPSKFPDESSKRNFSFAIPYQEKNSSIIVRIRLNGGPQFEGTWDSGCSVPLKISQLEANTLVKTGTLSTKDYIDKLELTVANGQKNEYAVYMLKSVSFMDEDGVEHTINDVPAVIDDNVGTDILIGLPVMQALGYSHEISQYDQAIYFKE